MATVMASGNADMELAAVELVDQEVSESADSDTSTNATVVA